MNKKSNKLNRSDIEAKIQKQLPQISSNQIKLSIDLIISKIVEYDETPAIGLEPVVKLGIDGTIECK